MRPPHNRYKPRTWGDFFKDLALDLAAAASFVIVMAAIVVFCYAVR